MYDYLSPEQVTELGASDDPTVRHASEDIREMARELLLARMREIGMRYLQNWNDPDVSGMLWEAVLQGPKTITEEEVLDLDRLCRMAEGWWLIGQSSTPEFFGLPEWAEHYKT